jgi:hypothetical protein
VTRLRRPQSGQQGQGLIEFALVVPVLMLLLIGMLDMGMAFNHNLTLEYATREGARVGGALVNGGGALGCNTGQSPNAANVDTYIMAAVQRVLESPGSPIVMGDLDRVEIYSVTSAGAEVSGKVNVWKYGLDAGPTMPESSQKLDFYKVSEAWSACNRTNAEQSSTTPGTIYSIGVRAFYTYKFQFGLGSLIRMFGPTTWAQLSMSDRTVMSFNPTAQ